MTTLKVNRVYKYKLYRTKKNRHLHRQITIAGSIRNHIIALQRRYYRLTGKHVSKTRMQAQLAKRRKGNKPWWRALSAQSVQQLVERVEFGYDRFFENLSQGKPRKVGLPGFKASRKYTSFTMKQDGWKLLDNVIGTRTGKPKDKNIRRTGRIQIAEYDHPACKRHTKWRTYKFVWTRPIRGDIKTVTIKRDRVGDFWVCFSVVETIELPESASTGEIGGFDFGLKSFLTNDAGQVITSPQFYRTQMAKIQSLSRSHSRKLRGSSNRERARLDLARAHRRIVNLRENHHWQLAHDLCDVYDVMIFETLNLRGMQRMWGRKINDLAFADFLTKLKHVAHKRGKRVLQIDQWEATTRTCCACGEKKQSLGLHERVFACACCGHTLDRDHNAALNIKRVGTSTCNLGDVRRDLARPQPRFPA